MRPDCFKTIKFVLAVSLLCCFVQAAFGAWRDAAYDKTLQNSTLEAKFQAGNLYKITDLATSQVLLNVAPAGLPSTLNLFGSSTVNLDSATSVVQTVSSTSVQTDYTWADGTTWRITWSLDGDDIVLSTSAHRPTAVTGFYITLLGCDIASHSGTAIDAYGKCWTMQAPFTGALLVNNGGTDRNGMPWSFAQAMVILFEGNGAGWVVDGRDPNFLPANIRPFGVGQTADLVISRAFPETLATQNPTMFEVRIRIYSGAWQNAVDPYTNWMQTSLGYVPIAQKTQTWVKNMYTQSYVTCGDTAALTALAAKVNPAETYLGRQAEYRYYAFDHGYPDYNVAPTAASWISQANSFGFHVGLHTNIAGIDRSNTALVQQMQGGLYWTGSDWDGTSTHYYCSAAYVPWRNYLINALAPVVNSGASVIYLDQSGSPLGKFVINGITGTQGIMLLMQQILQTYPGIALQTEGFNLMASRYACFALAEMPLGHPLSGYIFGKFIKIVPEGYMYSPTDLEHLDAFATWGHMLPGTDTARTESWQQIVGAFQQFNLVPNSRLSRSANQLSGFSGSSQAEAYFEKTATTRYLMVYRPYHSPEQYGVRYTNIKQWSGPGYIKDWLIFNNGTMYGLDPNLTYWFDGSVMLDPTRFHLTAVPADFLPYQNDARKTIPQEIGLNDTNFRLFFSGDGQIDMFVPDAYDVYLNNQKVAVNRTTDTATVTVSATQQNPSIIRAFQRSEQVLQGYWAQLQWMVPQHKVYVSGLYTHFPPYGFWNQIAGEAFIIGKFPNAESIRIQGSWGMWDDALNSTGDGVIRINGTEVMRLDPGQGPPYSMIPFDVDVTSFSGQYAMLEFSFEGDIHGADASDWDAPKIVATGIIGNPQTCAEAIAQGYVLAGDFNKDCYTNFADLVYLTQQWLQCVVPGDPMCQHPW